MRKNILLSLLIIVIGVQTYGQQVSKISISVKQDQDYSHYSRTHKTLRTLGWVSLGTGIVSSGLGLIAHVTSADTDTGEKEDWLIVTGGTLIAASVPLFIVSHHYKNKAASTLSLGSQKVHIPQNGGRTVSDMQPTVTLDIPLNGQF